jgi:hypothetical protein
MALFDCPECNANISDKAIACPKCGCPIEQRIQTLDDMFTKPTLAKDLTVVASPFQKNSRPTLKQISGYFSSEANPDIYAKDGDLNIAMNELGLVISSGLLAAYAIHFSQLVDISIENQKSIINKERAVLGRAALGGVLLGGAGAIVGAISGQGRLKSKLYDGVLILTYLEPSKDKLIQLILVIELSTNNAAIELIKSHLNNYHADKHLAAEGGGMLWFQLKEKHDHDVKSILGTLSPVMASIKSYFKKIHANKKPPPSTESGANDKAPPEGGIEKKGVLADNIKAHPFISFSAFIIIIFLFFGGQPEYDDEDLSGSAKIDLCKKYIASEFGRPLSSMRSGLVTRGLNFFVEISYTRRSDNSIWKNLCNISNNEISWASVDNYGNTGRWRHEDTKKLKYKKNDENLTASF